MLIVVKTQLQKCVQMVFENIGNCLKHPEVSQSNFSDKETMLNL